MTNAREAWDRRYYLRLALSLLAGFVAEGIARRIWTMNTWVATLLVVVAFSVAWVVLVFVWMRRNPKP